ncbi:hypothetical protein KKA24_01340 [Patescibacteria group bacterium]|nr:hypothetical protein [Patescibacteria group bacterium]
MARKLSPIKQKILLLLSTGISFGYAITPNRQWKVLKESSNLWRKIDRDKLKDEIRQLYQSRIIEQKENSDGSYTMVLSEKGKLKALTYCFEEIKIKRGEWDEKWRMVIFDIPEDERAKRDVFRNKIKEIGFCELQKSVWIFPYECENEINFIIEYYNLRRYIRFCIIESIDNEMHLKKKFKL